MSDRVNVYGVVKFVKPPFKSRGSDHCITFSITDGSYKQPEQKLKCIFFAEDESNLPLVKVGDIIRCHRLRVTSFGQDLQAISKLGFSWLIFSGSKDGPLEPRKSSSVNYTFTDKDKQMVQELRDWIEDQEELKEKLTKFEDIAVGCYFDTVCQVIGTAIIEPNVCMLLRVWDGTQTIHSQNKVEESTMTNVNVSNTLLKITQEFLVNVHVFDDHYKTAKHVQPGEFVKFYNLHAVKMPAEEATNCLPGLLPPIALHLHRGNSYGRSLRVVSPDSADLKYLKRRLKKITVVYDTDSGDSFKDQLDTSGQESLSDVVVISGESLGEITQNKGDDQTKIMAAGNHGNIHDSQEPSTSGVQLTASKKQSNKGQIHDSQEPSTSGVQVTANRNRPNAGQKGQIHDSQSSPPGVQTKRKIDEVNSEERISVDQAQDVCVTELSQEGEDQPASGVPRCMLQTATITLNHPNIKRTRIKDVLEHRVPFKSRVRAQIMNFHPKPSDTETFLQLYCSHCRYLCPVPKKNCNENSANSQLQIGSTFNSVVHYNCPQCYANKDSLTDMESPPHLQFIFMMRFILKDDTDMLIANLCMTDAEVFFQSITPLKLVQDSSSLTLVRDLLQHVCPEEFNTDTNPWIECCLKSYSVADGTKYQIVDTTIV